MQRAIWWVRRDLRLADNQALHAALQTAGANGVLPVYVLDPDLLSAPDLSPARLAFLFSGMRSLDRDLRLRGSELIVRQGAPLDELRRLLEEGGATAIFAEADPWPYGRQRDQGILRQLPLHLVPGITIREPEHVVRTDGNPYSVYTPYSRRWREQDLPPRCDLLDPPPHLQLPISLASLPIPELSSATASLVFPAGEEEARRRLRTFTEGPDAAVYRYGTTRNRLDESGCSQLSPYLRFGMLSARTAIVAAADAIRAAGDPRARDSADTWLSELIWREFYHHILFHFPEVLQHAFRPALRDIDWREDPAAFEAWCRGLTGYPVVDAAMRQLAAIGWIHNRGRMIAASFLVKDLLVDWRKGERFFMQYLLDGDPAANNGGWQWTAGVGTDAAPYFRVFNPIRQGQKFDPEGTYVRQWVPELAHVPARYIHSPWIMTIEQQRASTCIIGRDYPAPIVDHVQSRARALHVYRQSQILFG